MSGQEEMQQSEAIGSNPSVAASAAQDTEKAHTRHHDPLRHSPYYYKSFWGSYKGMAKGILGGLLIGAAVGSIIGGVVGIGLAVAGVEISAALIGACAIAFSAVGMLKGMHMFSAAGAAAGANAAVAEVQEKRILDGVSQIVSKAVGRPIPAPGAAPAASGNTIGEDNAHETERPHLYSSTDPNSKLYHGKIGFTGLVVGLAAGALLAGAAAIALPTLTTLGIEGFLAHAIGHVSFPAAMAACGLYGASYGIDRNVFRRAFDFTDKLFIGRFFTRKEESFSQDHQVTEQLPAKYIGAQPTVSAADAALVSSLQRDTTTKDASWQARLAAAQREFQALDSSNARVH